MTAHLRVTALLAAACLALAGCGVNGLSFVQDRRLEILAPQERATVELPVTVRWKVTDFRVTGPTGASTSDAGYFGVFVDRAPPPPGKTLESLADDDRLCQATEGCPDDAYLAGRGAYRTSDTHFVVESLPDLTRGERRDFHEVIIVLLDGTGARIGESAFSVEFQVERGRN